MRTLSVKKKELLILIGVLVIFAILLTVTALFFGSKSGNDHTSPKESERVLVEGVIAEESSHGNEKKTKSKTGSQAFFLKPSAEEVITALREADDRLEQPPEDSPVLKVMWPGYFFSLTSSESGETILQLDVDESGFGATLVCKVSLSDYPELKNLTQGRKIWVAGKVTAIDPEGTGSVHIDVEYIRFDEGPPQATR